MCICYGHARSCPLDEITKVFFDLIDLFSQNNFSNFKKKKSTLPKENEKEEAKRDLMIWCTQIICYNFHPFLCKHIWVSGNITFLK